MGSYYPTQPYGAQPNYGAPYEGAPGPDGDRGLGKALLAGAGAAIAGMGAYAVYSKTIKKKKQVKTKHGKTREIDCDVLVDQNGNELPGQEFDENGRCMNENEVLSRAGNGQPQPYGQNYVPLSINKTTRNLPNPMDMPPLLMDNLVLMVSQDMVPPTDNLVLMVSPDTVLPEDIQVILLPVRESLLHFKLTN